MTVSGLLSVLLAHDMSELTSRGGIGLSRFGTGTAQLRTTAPEGSRETGPQTPVRPSAFDASRDVRIELRRGGRIAFVEIRDRLDDIDDRLFDVVTFNDESHGPGGAAQPASKPKTMDTASPGSHHLLKIRHPAGNFPDSEKQDLSATA